MPSTPAAQGRSHSEELGLVDIVYKGKHRKHYVGENQEIHTGGVKLPHDGTVYAQHNQERADSPQEDSLFSLLPLADRQEEHCRTSNNAREGDDLQRRGNANRQADTKVIHRKINIIFLRHQQQELQNHRSYNPVENFGKRDVLLALLLCLQPLLFQSFSAIHLSISYGNSPAPPAGARNQSSVFYQKVTCFATRKTIRLPVSKNFVFFLPLKTFFALSPSKHYLLHSFRNLKKF